MSAPVRFLFVAVAGWTLFRGGPLGFARRRCLHDRQGGGGPGAGVPAIVPTEFPPIAPVQPDPRRWRPVCQPILVRALRRLSAASDPATLRGGARLLLSRSRARRGPSQSRFLPPIWQRRTGAARILRADSATRAMGPCCRSRAARCPRRPGRARPFPLASRPSSRKSISTGCSSAPGRCGAVRRQAPARSPAVDPRRKPGRRPPDLRIRSPDRRLAAVELGDRRKPGRAKSPAAFVTRQSRRSRYRSPPNGGRRSASSAPAAPPSLCSRKGASINSRSAGASCSTAMPRPASSGSAAATCSPTAG